ncbi:hypothetical protein HT031_001038 [Scenedesmus sp. PABB004]|nr:hypothetical protein HT031_001038 [Scenedesmus sp. PABB004]
MLAAPAARVRHCQPNAAPGLSGARRRAGGFCVNATHPNAGGNNQWDAPLCEALATQLLRGAAVLDLGAGLGHYGKCLAGAKAGIKWTGLDGSEVGAARVRRARGARPPRSAAAARAPAVAAVARHCSLRHTAPARVAAARQAGRPAWAPGPSAAAARQPTTRPPPPARQGIEEATHGFVQFADLTVPLFLGRTFDWVMSLEVGEHIPHELESVFLDNIARHASVGVLLTWAVPGQGGHAHVNNHPNEYVVEQMTRRSFELDPAATSRLRGVATLGWFKGSFMVFRRGGGE